jgi:RNA polymerase sigma-70 factor (ECF subfamily)
MVKKSYKLLVKAMKGKSELETQLKQIRKTVYRFLLYKTGDSETAEDLTQETLTKIYQKLSSYKGTGSFSRWALTIAKNTFYDWLRQTKNLAEPISDYETALPDDKSTEKLFMQKYMSVCLKQQVNSIGKKESLLLKAKFIQGLSLPEIAQQLNTTPSAVKTALTRAKKKLKERLVQECDFYYDKENKLCCCRKKELLPEQEEN